MQQQTHAQQQKHAAMAESVQPAVFIVIVTKGLSNLDDINIVCLRLP